MILLKGADHWEKLQMLSPWHIRGKVEKSNDALNGFRNCNNINGTEDVSYSGPWVMVPISFAYLARFTKGLRCDFKLSWHEQICKLCKVGMIRGDHQSPPCKKPQWRFSPNKTLLCCWYVGKCWEVDNFQITEKCPSLQKARYVVNSIFRSSIFGIGSNYDNDMRGNFSKQTVETTV